MKRTLWIFAFLGILLLAYAAWPVYGLYRIANVIENRDAEALDRLVDYPELRRSLSEQVAQAYLKATGKGQNLGAFASQIAVGVGATMADPMVEKLLNAKALLALFGDNPGAEAAAAGGAPDLSIARLDLDRALGSGWELFKNSEYGGGVYYVSLPPDAPPDKRFRLRLRLTDWQWKLAGVGLSEEVKGRIVAEIGKPR